MRRVQRVAEERKHRQRESIRPTRSVDRTTPERPRSWPKANEKRYPMPPGTSMSVFLTFPYCLNESYVHCELSFTRIETFLFCVSYSQCSLLRTFSRLPSWRVCDWSWRSLEHCARLSWRLVSCVSWPTILVQTNCSVVDKRV